MDTVYIINDHPHSTGHTIDQNSEQLAVEKIASRSKAPVLTPPPADGSNIPFHFTLWRVHLVSSLCIPTATEWRPPITTSLHYQTTKII